VTILTVLYSLAGLGIAIVNDFKSIEGDRCGEFAPMRHLHRLSVFSKQG